MNVATFICGPDGADDCFLPHKLRVLSGFCDKICVVLDRSPQSETICQSFRKVEVRHVDSEAADIGVQHDGPTWSEGRLRQAAWDFAAESNPKYVVLGDSDEIPTPEMAWAMIDGLDESVDCWLCDWPNLIHDAGHAIGGDQSAWSYLAKGSNKKGAVVRYVKGRDYRYRDATRHVRIEPSPVNEGAAVFNATHRLAPFKLIHYRWAAWQRWRDSGMSRLPKYQPWPPDDAQIVPVPRAWLHLWDADNLINRLPESIAVVGNGPVHGMGAEIDAHECVIRFNNWRTKGHKQNVGSKTTVWCTNTWDDVHMRPWTGDMLTVTTDAEQYDRNSKWLGMYPHMHVPRWSWTDGARDIKPENPSTGLVLLHRLATAGKRIDAYGFTGLSGGHYWNPEHVHDHGTESAAMAMLAAMGVRFA